MRPRSGVGCFCMALKAKFSRAELTKRLNRIEPNILKAAAAANLANAEDAAAEMADKARQIYGDGAFARSIVAERQADNPNKKAVGHDESKDPDAVGIYARFVWRWLEFGTAPHSLAKGGGTVLGKKKARERGAPMHPGSRAYHLIFPIWRSRQKKNRRRLLAAINKAIKGPSGHVD